MHRSGPLTDNTKNDLVPNVRGAEAKYPGVWVSPPLLVFYDSVRMLHPLVNTRRAVRPRWGLRFGVCHHRAAQSDDA